MPLSLLWPLISVIFGPFYFHSTRFILISFPLYLFLEWLFTSSLSFASLKFLKAHAAIVPPSELFMPEWAPYSWVPFCVHLSNTFIFGSDNSSEPSHSNFSFSGVLNLLDLLRSLSIDRLLHYLHLLLVKVILYLLLHLQRYQMRLLIAVFVLHILHFWTRK